MSANNSIFKTPESEKQYLELYETVLARWNIPTESLDIATRFGITHINAGGLSENPALILLPGFGANSTMWYPNVSTLSNKLRIYAVDTNGQPGKSLPSQKLTAAFLRHIFLPIMVHPTRSGLMKYFRWMTKGYMVDPNWGELMIQGILNTRPQPPVRATAFTDFELRSVKAPVLVWIGERSVIYNPQRAYKHAINLIPNVRAEIVPDASHALNAEKAEVVNALILEFCQL